MIKFDDKLSFDKGDKLCDSAELCHLRSPACQPPLVILHNDEDDVDFDVMSMINMDCVCDGDIDSCDGHIHSCDGDIQSWWKL